jgi:hypothetical protein
MTLYETLCVEKNTVLPIDKICRLSVYVDFEHVKERVNYDNSITPQCLLASIRLDWEYKLIYRMVLYNQEDLETFLNDIPKLKYSRLDNKLYLDDTKLDSTTYLKVMDLIPENKNMHLNIQECVVCMNITKTKTSCNHYLCAICETKIDNKLCPICRNYYGSDCDDDD